MAYLSEHLANLRREIIYLQSLEAQYRKRQEHNSLERLKHEQWQSRLRAIQQELQVLRETPQEPAVWWDRSRRSPGA